jgi:hypothetical protein
LTLCTLLCNNPLLNEPGVTPSHNDNKPYNEIIEFANLDIAVCDIVTKKNGIYAPFFEHFYPFVKENFIKNYDKLLEIARNKFLNNASKVVRTGYYSMCVNIDYDNIIKKLENAKVFIDKI